MEAIQEAEPSTAAFLTPRERMQMMKQSLLKDEAKEGSKPWEQSRSIRKKSRYLEINIPSKDRPPPANGILRRPSAASFTGSGSDYSLSPMPSPYTPECSDFGPPIMERRPSKVRFTSETTVHTSSLPNMKRQSSVDALRADLERAKRSLTGAIAASMNDLNDLEHSLRRLSAEDFDEAFKSQPLRMPRMSRALSALSSSSYGSEDADFYEAPPSRPPKSPLRHSFSASTIGSSMSGPSRSISISTFSGSGSGSSFSDGISRATSISTTSSSAYGLPSGTAYQSLLPGARKVDLQPSPSPSQTSIPSTPRTPTLNRSGWSGDAELSPRSTPQPAVPTVEIPDAPFAPEPESTMIPDAPIALEPESTIHSRNSSASIFDLTGMNFPIPPERTFNFGQVPKLVAPIESPVGETVIVEETPSTTASPAMDIVELAEETPRLDSSSVHEANSPVESPIITPADNSPLALRIEDNVTSDSVPLSFSSLDESDPLSMSLLEAAVEFEIVSPNSSLLKKGKGKRRSVKLDDDDDDGWMGSDAEEEEYYKAIRRIASDTPIRPRPSPTSHDSRMSRMSQLSSTSISTVASSSELLTPLPSSTELPSHAHLPSSSGSISPGRFAWGKSSPSHSPTPASRKPLPEASASTEKPGKKWPKPALDIDWGPPEILYGAMDWVWRPQDDSDSDETSPSGSSRATPRGSRSAAMGARAENDMEDLRNVTLLDEPTPRPLALDRVPSPPLRLPEGVEEWLMDEEPPAFGLPEVGVAM